MVLGANHVSSPFLGLWTPESEKYGFWGKRDALPTSSPQENILTIGAGQINP